MENEQLWVDTLSGMQNRATLLVGDEDTDYRNRNWYARKLYGDMYTDLKDEFQRQKMNEMNTESFKSDKD